MVRENGGRAMTNPAEMTPEQFIASRRHGGLKTGLANWLRALPLNTPTQVPQEMAPGYRTAIERTGIVSGAVRSAKLSGAARTFGDETWVMVTGPLEPKAGAQ